MTSRIRVGHDVLGSRLVTTVPVSFDSVLGSWLITTGKTARSKRQWNAFNKGKTEKIPTALVCEIMSNRPAVLGCLSFQTGLTIWSEPRSKNGGSSIYVKRITINIQIINILLACLT